MDVYFAGLKFDRELWMNILRDILKAVIATTVIYI